MTKSTIAVDTMSAKCAITNFDKNNKHKCIAWKFYGIPYIVTEERSVKNEKKKKKKAQQQQQIAGNCVNSK